MTCPKTDVSMGIMSKMGIMYGYYVKNKVKVKYQAKRITGWIQLSGNRTFFLAVEIDKET